MMIFFEVYIAAKAIIGHNCLSKSGQITRTPCWGTPSKTYGLAASTRRLGCINHRLSRSRGRCDLRCSWGSDRSSNGDGKASGFGGIGQRGIDLSNGCRLG